MPHSGFDFRQVFFPWDRLPHLFLFSFLKLLTHLTAQLYELHMFFFASASHEVKLRRWEVAVSPNRTYGTHTQCVPVLSARTRTLGVGRTDTRQTVRSFAASRSVFLCVSGV